ncbi:MAG: hypothetical protein KF799_10285 [Bdellovibrionales bacterium]|nr:hypothetical protein [Bdellovibrionales bacterium]
MKKSFGRRNFLHQLSSALIATWGASVFYSKKAFAQLKPFAFHQKAAAVPVFCTIASGSNKSATSPTGVTWTAGTLPSSATWSLLARSTTTFCAVASSGTTAATSSDGLSWTAQTLPTSASWSAICWNGSIFCVTSVGNKALTSSDGVTWSNVTLPNSGTWDSLVWNGSVFVTADGSAAGGTGRVLYSSNGTSWTAVTLPDHSGTPSTDLRSFRAFRNGTKFYVVSDSCEAYTSTNGSTWTAVALFPNAPPLIGTSNGTNFCVIETSGSYVPAVSADGISWTSGTLSAASWRGVAWNGTTYCAVASGGTAAATSTNGTSWTARTLPSSASWTAIAWG